MDIEGMGPAVVSQLLEEGLLSTIPDIYDLPQKRDALLELERMGEKSVDNLISAIEKSKKNDLHRLIYGLGLVFQIVDDVLDVTSTPEQLGKPIGSDSENGKTTFVTLYGAEGAMQLAQDLNNETCAELRRNFGGKAAFLEQLAQQLLVRKN